MNATQRTTPQDKIKTAILQGNIDDPLTVSVGGRVVKVDAWDFRHLIQVKGILPSVDDVDFERQCFKGGTERFDAVADIIRDIVLSDDNSWRVLRRAEYHAKYKSPLSVDLYARFAELMGSGYMEKDEGMSVNQYILAMATNTGSRKSKALGILMDEGCAASVDDWYTSMDLSGLYRPCYQRQMYQRIMEIANNQAEELAASDRPSECMDGFCDRLFDDISSVMRKEMNSDVDLKRAVSSDNLFKKLCDMTGRA